MIKRHVLRAVGTWVLAALAMAGAWRPAPAAEVVPAHRWLVGLDIAAATLNANDKTDVVRVDERANGPALQVGWLLKPTLMLRVSASAADFPTNIEGVDLRVGGGTFDVVWLPRDGQAFRPYVFAGAGGYQATATGDRLVYQIDAPGLVFGAGWYLRLRGEVLLHGGLRVESVRWPAADVTLAGPDGPVGVPEPLDRDGWGSRVLIGVAWRP